MSESDPSGERCADCGEPIADGTRSVAFQGEPYCAGCTTLVGCSNCGARGSLPKRVVREDATIQCSNCGDVLSTEHVDAGD